MVKKLLGLTTTIFAFTIFVPHLEPFVPSLLLAQQKNLEGLKGKTLPDFQIRDLNGKVYRFSQFRGKVLLLNFWSPY